MLFVGGDWRSQRLPGEVENLKERNLKVITFDHLMHDFQRRHIMVQFNIGGYLHFKQEKVISSDFFRSFTRLIKPVHWIHLGMFPSHNGTMSHE